MGRKETPHSQAVIQVWSGNVLICCCCCCHFHLECDSGTSKTHFTVLQQCVSKFGDPALCESRHCCEMSLVCLRASRNVDVVAPFWTSTTMHCCFCSWGTLPYSPSSPGPYFCKLNCKHDLDRLLPNTLQATQPPHQCRCSRQVHRFNIQSCFYNGYCKQLPLSTGGTTLNASHNTQTQATVTTSLESNRLGLLLKSLTLLVSANTTWQYNPGISLDTPAWIEMSSLLKDEATWPNTINALRAMSLYIHMNKIGVRTRTWENWAFTYQQIATVHCCYLAAQYPSGSYCVYSTYATEYKPLPHYMTLIAVTLIVCLALYH